MKNTYRDNKFGDRKPSNRKFIGGVKSRRPGFGGSGGFAGELHEATCASCGSPCRVPFRPNGSKPVLCGTCFKKNGPSPASRFERPSRDDGRPAARFAARPSATSNGIETRLSAIERKLDAIIAAMAIDAQ